MRLFMVTAIFLPPCHSKPVPAGQGVRRGGPGEEREKKVEAIRRKSSVLEYCFSAAVQGVSSHTHIPWITRPSLTHANQKSVFPGVTLRKVKEDPLILLVSFFTPLCFSTYGFNRNLTNVGVYQ